MKFPTPGDYAGRLEFLDRDGNVLTARTQQVRFSIGGDDRDTVGAAGVQGASRTDQIVRFLVGVQARF